MEGTAPESSRLKRVLAGPLLRVGALATLLSASANVVVLAGASSLFGPVVIPPEEVVTIGQVMGASTAGAVGAAVVFAAICRFTRRTIAIFWGLARGRRSAPFVHPNSLGGRHGIFCGDVGPYARGGRGHRRRSAHTVGPEGVGRVGAIRDLERKSVTVSLHREGNANGDSAQASRGLGGKSWMDRRRSPLWIMDRTW